ncbi:MAG: hypothetical protein IKR09_06145 [Alphaproteobacteria bacterium]|nr:hypothetical protein [Alphaproteobacteria bacterium]
MAEQLKEKASAEVAEKMKEWQPDKMSRAQQEKFVSSLLNIVKKEHQETETVVKGYELAWTVEGCTKFTKKAKKAYQWTKEPWRPEYDEMCLLFLTPEEIKQCQKKGMAKEDIVKEAKDRMVTAMWKEYREFGRDTVYDRSRKNDWDEINACQRSKRFYEEYIFNDDVVTNTLDAVSNKDYYRFSNERGIKPLLEEKLEIDESTYDHNKDVAKEKKFYKGIRDYSFLSALKEVFQGPEKVAEEKAKKVRIYHIRKELDRSDGVGKTCLDVLNKSGFGIELDNLGSVAGSVDLKHKKVLLNSSMLKEAQVLSLINAACCIVKNGKDGMKASKEVDAMRNDNPLTTQKRFAKEVEYYRPLYKAVVEWKAKAGNTNATTADKNVYTEKMIKDALAVKAKQQGR